MATFLYDIKCCSIIPWLIDDEKDVTPTCSQLPPKDLTESAEEAEKKRVVKEQKEALGWTLDASARGAAVMGTSVFVSVELLRKARAAAGCEADYYDGEGGGYEICENRVYGMKPSSLLTNIMTIVGLISAFLMPLIGSVIDHTAYRRTVGRVSAGLMTFAILLQMLLLRSHWFMASIMQVLVAFSYLVHLTVVYAYLPELTTSAQRLVQYTAQFTAAQYGSSVLFLVLMVVILSVVPGNRYSPVDFSQSVIVFICILFLGYAWTFLFRKRPASQHVPEGVPLFTAGFYKIFQTSRTILLHHSAIKWFLISVCFTEAATYTFSTIAITYMTDQLNFNSKENGVCILILLLFGVPGTRLAAWTNHINPIRSLQACLLLWIATTSMAALLLKNPGQQNRAYAFAMLWGLCLGWIHPTEKTLYCTIIPRGQEAELMGTYICAGQILSWVPSLVFSVLNEAGFSMRFGLFSLTFYLVASFFILFLVGDYEEAVAHARAYDNDKSQTDDSHYHHQSDGNGNGNSHKHPEADFVIISDYEEAVAHKQSMSMMNDESTEVSSHIVMPCT